MAYSEAEKEYIWLDGFNGLEYKHKRYIADFFAQGATLSSALSRGGGELKREIGENAFNTLKNSANYVYTDYLVKGLESRGITAVTPVSEEYPESLREIPLPPLVLYCKGDLSLLKGNVFAIVGSRKSLPLSVKLAENYVKTLAEANFTLVTGIAEGVDSAVLEKTLSVGGKAISVIAGGFDNVYPKSHANLLDRVIGKGLAVSEHPPEVTPQPYMFPVRNRIIAGLARGVLVVSGRLKSGTQYTAGYAGEYGKDLFAIPYSAGIESGAGCNDLIKRGAALTDSPEDILNFYGIEKKSAPALSESERKVAEVLRGGAKHVNAICRETDKKIFEITPLLTSLEIKGIIARTGANVYTLTRTDSEE